MGRMKGKELGTFDAEDALGRGVTANPKDDLDIGADLSKEMADQPGLYAWYGTLAEVAFHKAKYLKYEIHCLKEDLDETIRSNAKDEDKKLTEKAIEVKINSAPRMRKLYRQYLRANKVAGLLKIMKDAFQQRKDMLQSIGANKRTEEESEIRTLQRKAKVVTNRMKRETEEADDE